MSVTYRSTCRPTLGRYIERDVSVNIASDISVDTSADMSVDMSTDTSRSTHWPRVGRYVDRHIGRASVDMSTDMSVEMSTDISVEGFVNYTWSSLSIVYTCISSWNNRDKWGNTTKDNLKRIKLPRHEDYNADASSIIPLFELRLLQIVLFTCG